MALPFAIVRRRGHGVSKSKKAGGGIALGGEAIDQQAVLMLHHLLETFARDIALRMAIDGIANPHVVSGHALGDCA